MPAPRRETGREYQRKPGAQTPRRYQPHSKQRKDEAEAKRTQPGRKARRWVMERSHCWLNRFRKLPAGFERPKPAILPASPGRRFDLLETDNYSLRRSS